MPTRLLLCAPHCCPAWQVRLATHHLSRRKVAVKVIDKTKLSDQNEARRIQREIRVLKRLTHAAVIRLFEVLEAGPRLFLVMEYAPAGSLLDYVRSRKRLGEGEAAFFLQQIVAGLQYCHDNEVTAAEEAGAAGVSHQLHPLQCAAFLLRNCPDLG